MLSKNGVARTRQLSYHYFATAALIFEFMANGSLYKQFHRVIDDKYLCSCIARVFAMGNVSLSWEQQKNILSWKCVLAHSSITYSPPRRRIISTFSVHVCLGTLVRFVPNITIPS